MNRLYKLISFIIGAVTSSYSPAIAALNTSGAKVEWAEILRSPESSTLGIQPLLRIAEKSAHWQRLIGRGTQELIPSQATWVRFRVVNPMNSAIDRVFGLEAQGIQYVGFYSITSGRVSSRAESGSAIPFRNRSVKSIMPAFRITIRPQSTVDIYAKILAVMPIQAASVLLDQEDFAARETMIVGMSSGYLCFFFALFLLNLMIFLATRQRVYLYYLAFEGVFGLQAFVLSGFVDLFFDPPAGGWAKYTFDLGNLLGLFSLLFGRTFLQARRWAPRLTPLIHCVTLISAALVIGGLLNYPSPPSGWVSDGFYFVFASQMLLLLGAAVIALRNGFRPALYYIASWGFLFAGSLVYHFLRLGILAVHPLTTNAALIGSALEMLMLAFALHVRLNTMRLQLISQLEDAVRVRDDFLTIASHELRTPLTPLHTQFQLLSRLIQQDRLGILSKEQRNRIFASTDRQIKRLRFLVESILDANQIFKGALSLSLQKDVDLSEIVRHVVEDLYEDIQESGCSVEVDSSPVPVKGEWDPNRIDQVMVNLLTNALRYAKGKTIRITTRLLATEDQAEIRVQDQGIGIPLESQEKIFGRFERLMPLQYYGGLGLGLYIIRHIARAHKGDIRVESAPGHGATFVVRLPLRQTKNQAPDANISFGA